MTREIKFRAWDKSRKKMWSAEEMGQDQEALLPDGRGFANISGDSLLKTQIHSHLLPLQYTGLKDKKGREIYEGDIVIHAHTNKPCEVIYEHNKFIISNPEAPYEGYSEIFEVWEVIGNIYETPELLKEQDASR